MSAAPSRPIRDRLQNWAVRGLLGALLLLPYGARVRTMGWIAARVIGPLAGWRKRIRANLAHVRPDLSEAEVKTLTRAVPDNVGRTLIEIYSGAEFKARVAQTPLTGPGLEPLREARDAGRPVVLVTAHLGNYDALRAALFAHGFPLGALYREMQNAGFNAHYVKAMSAIGEPVFPATRKGLAAYVGHLAKGGIIGILTDVWAGKGVNATFFGEVAPTATSACDWALKYQALVIPCYGIRRPDGLTFEVRLETPIPHSDAATMTQALNDNLESQVRAHMDQWFWIHRRWKPERQREDG